MNKIKVYDMLLGLLITLLLGSLVITIINLSMMAHTFNENILNAIFMSFSVGALSVILIVAVGLIWSFVFGDLK